MLTPPCERCKQNNLECVIGTSNRGGRRVRKRTVEQAELDDVGSPKTPTFESSAVDFTSGRSMEPPSGYDLQGLTLPSINPSPSPAMFLDPALRSEPRDTFMGAGDTRESSAGSASIAFNELQNPSDALGILAQIASNGGEHPSTYSAYQSSNFPSMGHPALDYALVRDGKLAISRIAQLLQRYQHYYHPYWPIVPAATLDPTNLAITARDEKHLLTAILVIASRDLTDEPKFAEIAEEFLAFVAGAELIIHNAPFDVGFLNAELGRIKKLPVTTNCTITDTLAMARDLHPGKRNNLDALCDRYQVDNSARTVHGALLDAELLSDVYIAMTRGQDSLAIGLDAGAMNTVVDAGTVVRPAILKVVRAEQDEQRRHAALMVAIDEASAGKAVWFTSRPDSSVHD